MESVTLAAYLNLDEAASERLELFHGSVLTMASVSGSHITVQASLAGLCGHALRNKRCRFYGENAKVAVERSGSGYHPDGTIACPPGFLNERAGVVANPCVVFEILSPSTERFDRRDKFDDYALVPTIKEIVLIETETARVEVFECVKTVGSGGSISRAPRRTFRPRELIFLSTRFTRTSFSTRRRARRMIKG